MKYIRHKKLGFIIFEPHITHERMALMVGSRKDILSAGRVATLDDESMECFDNSLSLGKTTGHDDTMVLNFKLKGL